ncbi:MAG TPA: hypothetical protein DIW47_00590 [Bacteroidetes bacterium]|nr:hypothetical protein [Bacteroidota bacterium]
MTSGKIIDCKVTEVGTEEIKYKVSTEADAATFSVKKIDVIKIEFANGHVEKFKEELDDPDLYKDNKKNAWKFDFASPLFSSSIFGYERSIRPGFSLEANLGIIGMGYDIYNVKPRGALLKFGPKFMKTPDFRTGSLRYYHVLKGAYIQPQVIFGIYESDVNHYYGYWNNGSGGRETTTYGNVMINFGKQSVFANAFLIDIYAGVGYGFSNTTTNNINPDPHYNEYFFYTPTFGVMDPDMDIPVSITAGIKFGFLTR